MPADTASEWDQAEAHARRHPLRTEPLKREAIKVTQQPHPEHDHLIEFRAHIHLGEVLSVDEGVMRYQPEVAEQAEMRLRDAIWRRMYGRVREDARALERELRRVYLDQDERKAIEPLLSALIKVGHELTDKP